jgi:sulfite oxidase
VYDITDYVAAHPGGHFIKQAFGGPVEQWWQHWTYHHLSPKVAKHLEDLRIGRLSDWQPADEDLFNDELYEDERANEDRDSRQHIFFARPCCSETKSAALATEHYTPNAAFYIRNHAPVPAPVPPSEHVVEFSSGGGAATGGAGSAVASLTVAELAERFGGGRVTSVLQCAGNRANENIRMRGLSGFSNTPFESITVGMLGNAVWGGPRLLDVLDELYPQLQLKTAAGLAERVAGKHVELEGADQYVTSIPLERVVEAGGANAVLLATTMNGEPLPPDHGFPVRALIPGFAGARSVKWLSGVRVIEGESRSAWNRVHYRHPSEGVVAAVDALGRDVVPPAARGTVPCEGLPLNSVILVPSDESFVAGAAAAGGSAPLSVQGVAYSGSAGTAIASVEVSCDRGVTWAPAQLEPVCADDVAEGGHSFGWRRWQCEVSRPAGEGGEVWCRATDSAGLCQPELGLPVREQPAGGYFFNGWHRVRV